MNLTSLESDINSFSNQLNSAHSLPIGSLSLETSATALCGRYVISKVRARKDFFPKEETVASRAMLCLQRGWCALGVWAFGLGIFDVFCHYMLSSGGLAGRFCPMVQLASATHMAAGGNLSRFRFRRLCICSFQPRSKVPPQDRRFWAPKRGSKSKASNQAAFIGLPCNPVLRKPLLLPQKGLPRRRGTSPRASAVSRRTKRWLCRVFPMFAECFTLVVHVFISPIPLKSRHVSSSAFDFGQECIGCCVSLSHAFQRF